MVGSKQDFLSASWLLVWFLQIVYYVIFEVFTEVTMKNGIFWDVAPYGSYKNRRFGGT
jgi:hypothetical protein